MKKQNILIKLAIALLLANSAYSQVSTLGTVAGAGTEFGGWDGTGSNPKDYDLRSGFSSTYNMNFWTNGNPGTKRMTILGTGEVGIGNFTPAHLLDVDGGDINLNTVTKAYMINNAPVLQHLGNWNNIFVGVDAAPTNAGGDQLTYVGSGAGFSNNDASYNTGVGFQALYLATDNGMNAAFGYQALWSTQTPCGTCDNGDTWNTAVGFMALTNSDADRGTAIGHLAGYNSLYGNRNTFAGFKADVDASTPNITNVTAIGNEATVMTDNTIIMGNNDVSVGIGLSGDATGPLAKLHVKRDIPSPAVVEPYAVYIENSDGGALGFSYGLYSGTTASNAANFAGVFKAENASFNYAGFFVAGGEDYNDAGNFFVSGGVDNCGVRSVTTGNVDNNLNYAVIGEATPGTNTSFNVGIYGNAPGSSNSNGTTPNTGSWAVYADGDIGYTGGLYGPLSDSTFKTSIQPLDNAETILNQLNSYSFYYDTVKIGKSANVSHLLQYGVMAQELERVSPNLVLNTILPPVLDSLHNIVVPAKPVKMVNYVGLIPLLVEGYNKQQARIDSLVEAIAQLNNTGQKGTGNNINGNTQHLSTELTDVNAIVLDQNSPNPFAEQTKITWNIPETSSELDNGFDAKLFFYNKMGTILRTVKIEQTGYGELTVYANNLGSGSYTYSLVLNGKVIDTKTMVKGK